MKEMWGKKTHVGLALLAWLSILLWGCGTLEARFTDFDEVICQFTMDAEPPELYVTEPIGLTEDSAPVVSRTECTVSGTVSDPGGVATVTVNGQKVDVNEKGQWSTVITLTPDVLTEVIVKAMDRCGNVACQTRYVIHKSAAYALYSDTDQSLTFVRAADPIRSGTYIDGKYIRAVYTGFETAKYTSYTRVPWTTYRYSIRHVIVQDPIYPDYTAYWFYSFQNCQDMELKLLDTSKVTDMQHMFNSCKSLTSLDLSGMDTTAPGNKVSNMFFSNNLLAEITLGEKCNVRYPFPTPSPQYIEGADGKWYHTETGIGYLPREIPKDRKATYVAVKPQGQFPPYVSVNTPSGTSEEDPTYVSQSQYMVEGTALDDNGPVTVTVNGVAVDVDETGAWSMEMTLPRDEIVAVVVTATDQEGLSTTEIRYVCSIPLTVHFDANGGHFETGNVNTVSYFGTEPELSDPVEGAYQEPVHSISELVFAGWYTTADGQTGTEFTLSPGIREITVYAAWKDVVPPKLEVIDPASQNNDQPTLTEESHYVVRGTVSDQVGVASVTVNGKEVEWSEDGSWHFEVSLGADVVTLLQVVAKDLYGNATMKTCYVSYDESGPVLTMSAPMGLTEQSPTYCGTSQYVAKGTATDTAGIRSLTVNGETGELEVSGNWSHVLSLEADQVTEVTAWAEDTLEKTASLSRYVYYDSLPPCLGTDDGALGTQEVPVQASSSRYVLSGTVSDVGSGVAYVRINDTVVAVDPEGKWQYSLDLQGGITTQLTIEAADQVGNEIRQICYVRYDGFTVIYDANGGVFFDGSTIRPLTYYWYENGTVLAKPENYEEPHWKSSGTGDWGYIFCGWYTSPDCSEDHVFDSENAQPGMTVYAKWEPRPRVMITYHANGGSFGEEESNLVAYVWAEEKMQVADGEYRIPTPKASCWQFDGWYTSPDGEEGTEFVLGQESKSGTVYAKWNDVEAPKLQITSPVGTAASTPHMTDQQTWLVEGTVMDNGSGIREVTVQGVPVAVDDQGKWNAQVTLEEDSLTTITVIAVDVAGNSTAASAYVYSDRTRPSLTVITPAGRTKDTPTYAVSASYLVTGTVSDDDEISQVKVNGIVAQRQESGSWWCPIQLTDGTTQTVEVTAVDRGGNVITELRYVRYDSTIRFEEFTVTLRNRHKIGYTSGMAELEIPETFYDGETNTWYHVVAIGFHPGESTSINYAAFANETTLTKVTVPGSVKKIGRYAFYDATGITQLSLGYGIQEVDLAVFHGCNGLTSVSLPDSITELGSGAFMMSKNLKTANLPKGLTSVYADVFCCCYQLTGQMVIPAGVQEIGSSAFLDTEITSVVIPASVTYVRENAFRSCDQLTDVYYEGTAQQWDEISMGSNNQALLTAQIHYQYGQKSQYGQE